MKDMIRVDVEVDEGQYREATGLVRFDADPQGDFFNLIDSKIGALTDEINAAVLGVLSRANPKIAWRVSATPWSTPMTERGRYARAANGQTHLGKQKGFKAASPRR
jgi:hypothetical protein